MHEVVATTAVSTLARATVTELAHEETARDLADAERRRRREALLHHLELARERRRRRPGGVLRAV
ncbi:hypothetical protein GCM10027194_11370 [Thalassiella azotivora]